MVNYFWNNQLICVALARSAVSDDTFALLGEDVPHDGSHPWELQGLSALWVLHTKGERSSWPAWRSKLWPHLKRLLSSIRCESITGASEKHRGHIWDAITQNTVRAGYDHRSCVLGHNDGLPAQPEQQAKCFHLHISIWFTGMQISCFGSLNWQSWAAKVCLVQLISLFNWYQKYHKLFWVVESGETKKKKSTETWLFCRPYRTPWTSWLRRRGRRESKRRKKVEGKPRPRTTSELFQLDLFSCRQTKHCMPAAQTDNIFINPDWTQTLFSYTPVTLCMPKMLITDPLFVIFTDSSHTSMKTPVIRPEKVKDYTIILFTRLFLPNYDDYFRVFR